MSEGRVPLLVRLDRTIRGDFPFHKTAAHPGDYLCEVNPRGAVSVLAENGKRLGLKPGEFQVLAWKGDEPNPVEDLSALQARLEVETSTAFSLLRYLTELRFALGDDGKRMQDELLEYCRELRRNKDAIQAALGNGADEDAWRPGEHWADAAVRAIRAQRGEA